MTIQNRVIVGVMLVGMVLAVTAAPAQVVLAAPNETSPTTNTTQSATTTLLTSPPTAGSNTPNTHGETSGNGPTPTTPSLGGGSGANTTGSTQTPLPQTNADTTTIPGNSASTSAGSQPDQSTTPANGSTNTTQNTTGQGVDTSTISNAQSGDVTAKGNQSIGNATSGDANSIDTQVNVLNSSTTLNQPGGLQTYTFNINGDHTGDIVLSPAEFLQSSAATDTQSPENAVVTNQTNSSITNTIDLSARSGSVDVVGNRSAGDATSGNAATQANIMNMINSVVTDKQAFIGEVNINGNLKGNLLLPQSAIDSLLPTPTGTSESTNNTSTTITDNNLNVTNNVSLKATSGNVTVSGNGNMGSATTGSAKTNLKLYNLTNSHIVGGNVLLVFVNVMGSWVGLLMNAPSGTTSAALGGGITQDTALSTFSSTTNGTSESITNNINLTSTTGDVTTKGNQTAGNATSGNASANADVVNILGSQVDLTGWLGVLVINVYGSWQGSLEIQQAQVTVHVDTPPVQQTTPAATHHTAPTTPDQTTTPVSNTSVSPLTDVTLASAHIAGASTTGHSLIPASTHAASAVGNLPKGKSLAADMLLAGIGAILAIAGGVFQFLSSRNSKRLSIPPKNGGSATHGGA